MTGLWIVRALVVAASAWGGAASASALGGPPVAGTLLGAVLGGGAVAAEIAGRRVAAADLAWAGIGGLAGLLGGVAVGGALAGAWPAAGGAPAVVIALWGAYLGAALGWRWRGETVAGATTTSPEPGEGTVVPKIVDTSVIIDGRIVDICEAGFVEGVLVVPRFVLGELQHVADAPDPLKRNRGKRGFEVLQRLQRSTRVRVEISEEDFPAVREVDLKVIELARARGGRVLTTDYNLNRLAEVSGLSVLNVNDLANAMKPPVLAGEVMQVQVVREGKESGQGVAFLDDGTMVVVDQGRKHLGQTLEV
ncbi:MAG TPA: PIN domain-containing protein, partial [Candidatus Limnocylindria bacterium]|nr:PIN domain-containing protein [Candidatus Limnocylindria bacterium]